MKSKIHIQEWDNVSRSPHVKDATPMSHLAEDHEMFNYCLLTLAWISPLGHQFWGWGCWGGGWGGGGLGDWWRWRRGIKPLHYQISLSLSLTLYCTFSYHNGSPDQELQMISWQFFTLFKPVMFYQLICYDTLFRIQLWIRDVSWG